MKNAGAHVTDDFHVRVPVGLVEKALTSVPKRVTLYDRHGKPSMFLEECRCYYGTGSDCLYINDQTFFTEQLWIMGAKRRRQF
jgi:trimethylamine--corrinoid protein Co-methyltransferase